ncbi:MAG: hypothetical protein NTW25_12500 [Candidatus Kapabacteria bacterium]|nr:hypothetical protein [Candidatus Kapabacteria bacterium]
MQQTHNIKLTDLELSSLLEAYSTLQNFLEKVLTPDQIYNPKFINELNNSIEEVESKNFVTVSNFEDFVK